MSTKDKIIVKLAIGVLIWGPVHFAVPPIFEVPPLAWWLSLLIAMGIAFIGVEVLDIVLDPN